MKDIKVHISDSELSIEKCLNFIDRDKNGGINIFVGSVRKATEGREVDQLEFEVYRKMAIKYMRIIAEEAQEKYDIETAWIAHRSGTLQINEIPVIIGAGAPHRDAAFKACRFMIDELKKRVPIWKKEIFKDGEEWVSATS